MLLSLAMKPGSSVQVLPLKDDVYLGSPKEAAVSAYADQSLLVGGDDQLGAVAGLYLHHGPVYVRPDCQWAHDQPFGDLLVRHAVGGQGG